MVDVALDPRTGGARERVYTYAAYPGAAPGDAVFAPIAKREALGFVTAVYEADEVDLGFRLADLRELRPIEGLSLPGPMLKMVHGIAEATLSPLATAYSAAVPPGLRERIAIKWELSGHRGEARNLVQAGVLRSLEAGEPLLSYPGRPLEPTVETAVEALRAQGVVRRRLILRPVSERRKAGGTVRLCDDPARVERFLVEQGPRKPAQALVVAMLQEADHARLTPEEVKAMAGVTDATLKALFESGLLERDGTQAAAHVLAPEPNLAQRIAIKALETAITERRGDGFLLFGVTGSGKTEVYLRAIAEALRAGRQALFLVPEIALAAQAIAALRERFGPTVVVLHSDLPAGERLRNWTRAREGSASVVVGARSAVFAPLSDLGVIVVDEEHEPAYKQESAPRYHARDAVRMLAASHRCPYVLGSATPSVESFGRAEEGGDLTLLTLPARVAGARLPEVRIEDLTFGFRTGRPAILSDPLTAEMAENLSRGEQTILFLNRRAYAPFVVCRDCGHRAPCPRCSVSLSFHRRDRVLRCHQCGHHELPPDTCPQCGGLRLAPFGLGVEKVEETARELFPQARVARLDRDVAQRRGAAEEILAAFRAGELDILVGTQMVAKGLHFPNVTLVGVVAADVTLNLPDFRAAERTFDLLAQVSGRAGRGEKPGRVIVQTFNPGHVAVETARRHDYLAFYEHASAERRQAGYPPFRRLVNIVLSGESRPGVIAAGDDAAERLAHLEFLGPTDCVLERVADRWRRHILVKLPAGVSPRPVGEALLGFRPKDVTVVVDVDPHSLL